MNKKNKNNELRKTLCVFALFPFSVHVSIQVVTGNGETMELPRLTFCQCQPYSQLKHTNQTNALLIRDRLKGREGGGLRTGWGSGDEQGGGTGGMSTTNHIIHFRAFSRHILSKVTYL